MSRIAITAVVALAPLTAVANGGPSAWTGTTASGGVVPVPNEDVRLVSEDLSIVVEDLQHYRVQARYVLANAGPPVAVDFGVPLTWSADSDRLEAYLFEDPPPEVELDDWQVEWVRQQRMSNVETAQQIEIRLEGRQIPCQPAPAAAHGPGLALEAMDAQIEAAVSRPAEDEYDDWGDGEVRYSHELVRTWCVADLELPTQDAIALTLSYRGELWHVDMVYSKSPFTEFSRRWLSYLLFPAGYWQGRAERVDVTVETGPYAGAAEVRYPPGAVAEDSALHWHLEDVDLTAVPVIQVGFHAAPMLHQMEVATWHHSDSHPQAVRLEARAASARPAEAERTFEPLAAVDGDPTTAWCAPPGEAQPWIELLVSPNRGASEDDITAAADTALDRLGVIPGDAAAAATFSSSARPTRIVAGPCDDSGAGLRLELADDRPHDRSARVLYFDQGDQLDPQNPYDPERALAPVVAAVQGLPGGEEQPSAEPNQPGRSACLRITVEAASGEGPVCISELALIGNTN